MKFYIYFNSTNPLLNLYLFSTWSSTIRSNDRRNLRHYSHTGNMAFPHWE